MTSLIPPIRVATDQELFEQFLIGDTQQAFTQIYQRHAPMIYSVCVKALGNSEDAQDAVQETFMALVKRKHSLRPIDLLRYLRRSARYAASEISRQRGRHAAITQRAQQAVDSLDQLAILDTRHDATALLQSLALNSPAAERLLRLRFIQGYDTARLATDLQISQAAVRTRLRRACVAARLFNLTQC